MYTGTRLTTAIHRRLRSRFFLRGDVCTQAIVVAAIVVIAKIAEPFFPPAIVAIIWKPGARKILFTVYFHAQLFQSIASRSCIFGNEIIGIFYFSFLDCKNLLC